jgi:hypothetical protein
MAPPEPATKDGCDGPAHAPAVAISGPPLTSQVVAWDGTRRRPRSCPQCCNAQRFAAGCVNVCAAHFVRCPLLVPLDRTRARAPNHSSATAVTTKAATTVVVVVVPQNRCGPRQKTTIPELRAGHWAVWDDATTGGRGAPHSGHAHRAGSDSPRPAWEEAHGKQSAIISSLQRWQVVQS